MNSQWQVMCSCGKEFGPSSENLKHLDGVIFLVCPVCLKGHTVDEARAMIKAGRWVRVFGSEKDTQCSWHLPDKRLTDQPENFDTQPWQREIEKNLKDPNVTKIEMMKRRPN